MTTQLAKCLGDWNCTIQYRVNWNANGNSQEVRELTDSDVKIRLHQRGNSYFIEERVGKSMYPTMYKVNYAGPVEVTEEDYQKWLTQKK